MGQPGSRNRKCMTKNMVSAHKAVIPADETETIDQGSGQELDKTTQKLSKLQTTTCHNSFMCKFFLSRVAGRQHELLFLSILPNNFLQACPFNC